MFQYKIIHNILPTKVSLFKAKTSDNDICPQCLTDRHSLDHMFLHWSLTLSFNTGGSVKLKKTLHYQTA